MFNSTKNNQITSISTTKTDARINEIALPRRRSIIREFALNTSTHALPGIARSQSRHNRIFWSISFTIFTGVMSYFVTQSIINYFQYPTQTSVSVVIERSQDFPAVTICNYSPARFDLVIGPFLNSTNRSHLINTTNQASFTLTHIQQLQDFLIKKVSADESVEEYFFSLDTMLISCFYNSQACDATDFISFTSAVYGLCATFNAKRKNDTEKQLRLTNQGGGIGKLLLRLYAHSHLYIPFLTDDVSAGIVTMIHDNTELPLIDVAGINLSPGKRHKLNYKKKNTKFLPKPYTDCTTKTTPAMNAMFMRYSGADYAYSQGVCYILCTQHYIYHQCNCVSPDHWSARSVPLDGTDQIIEAPLCDINNFCFINATLYLSESDSLWEQYCSECKPACSTVDFTITPSTVPAPTNSYASLVKAFVESTSVPLPTNWTTDWETEIQRNYVSLEVVCQSNMLEDYTQEASLSAVDVLSNVGGHTGLWIGISFLSIMEFVEMLYRLVRHEIRLFRRKMRHTNA